MGRKRNKEKSKAYCKKNRLAHKAKCKKYDMGRNRKDYQRAYYFAHKKETNARSKAYQLAHAEEIKEYRREHPEKSRGYERKKRALKRGSNHEPYTGNYIFERDGWICQICGRRINKRLKHPNPLSKSIDHIVPISKGGADAPSNVQAAHLRCNLGKNATNKGQLRLFG